MLIDAMDDFGELNSFSSLRFDPVNEWNGRGVEVLNQGSALPCIRLETCQNNGFSLKSHEIKPMMAKVGVSHTNKNGEKTEIEFTVDTRDPPKAEPPPQPEKPKNL